GRRPPPAVPTRRSSDLHDRHVALPATLLDDEAPQLRAVVVEKLSRTHGARHEYGVGRELQAFPRRGGAACQNAQQPGRQIIEIRSEEHTSDLQSRENLV